MTSAETLPGAARQLIGRTRRRLAAVSENFHRFSAECDLAGPPDTYVFAGWSLLNQRDVAENPDLRRRVIRVDGKVEDVILPFSAREVYFKTHARILGLHAAPNLTVKMLQIGRSLRREWIARTALEPKLAVSPHVHIPALHRYGKGGHWLVEEFVEGERVRSADLASFLNGGAAREFHAASSRIRAIGQRPSTAPLPRELARLDPSFPWIKGDARLPVGIIHGDLDSKNLLHTEGGRFCMIDFDKCRVAPVAADLVKMFVRHPKLREAICGFLCSLDPTGTALPPKVQLALGVVCWSYWHRQSGAGAHRGVTQTVRQILAG